MFHFIFPRKLHFFASDYTNKNIYLYLCKNNSTRMQLIPLAILQSLLLAGGQVFLKLALERMLPFGWNWQFWGSVLANWQFALCGLLYGAGTVLWFYIIKHFPFSMAYPMVSLSYVFGMIAAMLVFHEEVSLTRWLGVLLIMAGCYFIAK